MHFRRRLEAVTSGQWRACGPRVLCTVTLLSLCLSALLCSIPAIAAPAPDDATRVNAGDNSTADASASKKQADTEKSTLKRAQPTLKRVEVGLMDRLATGESYRTITGKEYLLGPYDELSISVHGPKPETWSVTVSPQGVIEIPLVGGVRCAGMSIAELEKSLAGKLNRYLRNFTLSIVVTRLRGIQVTVTGQVAVPGSYSLPGQASLWEAIQASGGITEAGSVRAVHVRSADGKERRVDLYPFLFQGQMQPGMILAPGDTVHVPAVERIVGLDGEVRRPGLYEFLPGETMAQLLAFAGGPSAQAALDRAYVERILPDRQKLILAANLAASSRLAPPIELRDGDILTLPPISLYLGNVEITGEVHRPGTYERKQNMRLRDLLNLAGGLTGSAAPGRSYIYRVRENRALEVIWVNLARAVEGAAEANIELHEGDRVVVPAVETFAGKVTIAGEVRKPLTRPLATDMTVRDLLLLAGGVTVSAAPDKAFIERIPAPGSSKQLIWLDVARAAAGDPKHNLVLQDGDTLVVPNSAASYGKVSITGELRGLIAEQVAESKQKGLDQSAGADVRAQLAAVMHFDLADQMRISDLVRLAGGPTATAALQSSRLIRVGPDGIRQALDVDLAAVLSNIGGEQDLLLRDGDSVHVPSISLFQQTVRVVGELVGTGIFEADEGTIKRRGLYELKEGDTVRDLVQAAGGCTANAALRAARIERLRPDGTIERIPVDLHRLLVEKDSSADVALQNGDEFTVPAIADMVYVVGAVNQPGAYEYHEGNNRMMDMLARAGGATPRAVLGNTRLIRNEVGGKQDPIRVDMDAVIRKGKIHLDPGVRPGDIIFVPEKSVMLQDIMQLLANISLLRFYLDQ
jgi:protein involved in polysaccharide export with SLBB domain